MASSSSSKAQEKLPVSRHFFKAMAPGFQSKSKLNVPLQFCPKLKGEKANIGTLASKDGIWNVEIGRSEEGNIWFGKGWQEFARYHDLRVADFAVFEHLGYMNFSVILLDSCGCEKKSKKEVDPRKNELHGEHVEESSEFRATIKEYHVRKRSPYFHMPVEFCRSNSIFRNSTIHLTGQSGKTFQVSLRICRGGNTLYASITSGWREFFLSNKLKVGDVCIFKLDPSKNDSESFAMDVRVI